MARSRWSFALVGSLVFSSPASAAIERAVGADGVIDLSNEKSRGKRKVEGRVSPVLPAANAGGNATRFDAHIREAAALYRLPEALIRAVIKVESNFDPRAVSHANAHGLMQLLPST